MRPFCTCILAVLIVPIATIRAQPAELSRTLKRFDFEERRLGNVEDIPMHWVKVQGDGLPHYVNGHLTADSAHSGSYSFRLDLNGGGLIYRYPSGRIPIQPHAHYRVECFVRMPALAHARAMIRAYFSDRDGNEIDASRQTSELYPGDDAVPWKQLSVELSARSPDAVFLVVELGLLQPMHYAPDSLGDRSIHSEDIRGSAWFDDVTVSQIPKATLSTDRAGNVFTRSESMRIHVEVNDRFTDDLSSRMIVTDATGNAIFQRSGGMIGGGESSAESGTIRRMTLDLPDLPPGWYEATFAMTSQDRLVAQQSIDLIRLGDDNLRLPTDARFGIDATALPFAGWGELPSVLLMLGAGRVKLAVWSKAGDVQQSNAATFDSVLESLRDVNVTPTACLIDLPPDIVSRIGSADWSRLLEVDPKLWQPQLAYLVARHANHLDRWQLGADGSELFVTHPRMRAVYDAIYREFTELVQKPDLAMPWPAWYDLDGNLPATIALSVPSEVLPTQLPAYMQDVLARGQGATGAHNLSVHLQPITDGRYPREVRIRDFAQRFAYALVGGATRIDLDLPFSVRTVDGKVEKQPSEMLLVLRTLMSNLGGAHYVGKLQIADGVEALLFARDDEGIVMLWDRSGDSTVRQLAVNFGPNTRRVDLWGNVTALMNVPSQSVSSADDSGGSSVPVRIDAMPCFLVGIDGPLAQLRAGVKLDNDHVESSFKEHVRRLQFTNPYRTAISGTIKLKAPAGWTVMPPTIAFSLNPGETFDRELRIQFPYNTFAGSKNILAQFAVQADRTSSFTVPIALRIGLTDVGMQTLALRDGRDIIVHQMITNYGDKPINYDAFALLPGLARQERLVSNLAPGRTTIKKYRFTNVLPGNALRLRSGLREMEGTRILNEAVEVR